VTLIDQAPAGTPSVVTDLGTLFMPLEGLVDLEAERKRITAEIAKVEAEIAKVNAKLADPNFVEKVPAALRQDHPQPQPKRHDKTRDPQGLPANAGLMNRELRNAGKPSDSCLRDFVCLPS